MNKKLSISIMLIILTLTFICVYFYKNNAIFLKNIFNNEKKIDISLCGETYNVIDINVNGKYITRDLITKESTDIGFEWCKNLKAVNGVDNSLQVKYNNQYPDVIIIIYRTYIYEYIVKKDGIYIIDQHAGDLGQKVLDLK